MNIHSFKYLNVYSYLLEKMPEFDRGFSFTGLHILMILMTYNLIANNGSLFEYIGTYFMTLETPNLLFFSLHIFILYLILSNLTFEFGFRAAIKFKL